MPLLKRLTTGFDSGNSNSGQQFGYFLRSKESAAADPGENCINFQNLSILTIDRYRTGTRQTDVRSA